ncbi:protein semi-rolled leaf 2 [Tanacetum coccineum]
MKRIKGTWLSSFTSLAYLRLFTDCGDDDDDDSGRVVVTVTLVDHVVCESNSTLGNESFQEEHDISKLNFTWPQVACLSGFPARGSKVVFMSYKDRVGQARHSNLLIHKFAVRFATLYETERFINSVKEFFGHEKIDGSMSGISITRTSSQSEIIPRAPQDWDPISSSANFPQPMYSCYTTLTAKDVVVTVMVRKQKKSWRGVWSLRGCFVRGIWELKSYVIQTTTALAQQVRSEVALKDIGYVSDLCRHLRKSLQATAESVGELKLSLNTLLQSSIEDCLLEIAKEIADARPLFDVMSTTLENLPSSGIVARTITGSMIILAHMIVVALFSLNKQQAENGNNPLEATLSQDVRGKLSAFPPSFTSLLMDCFPAAEQEMQSTVPEEVALKKEIMKYLEGSSFQEMMSKVQKVVNGFEDDLRMQPVTTL